MHYFNNVSNLDIVNFPILKMLSMYLRNPKICTLNHTSHSLNTRRLFQYNCWLIDQSAIAMIVVAWGVLDSCLLLNFVRPVISQNIRKVRLNASETLYVWKQTIQLYNTTITITIRAFRRFYRWDVPNKPTVFSRCFSRFPLRIWVV